MNPNSIASEAPFLADNLALDFINSEYRAGEELHDSLHDDRSVLNWLTLAGVLSGSTETPPGLLAEAPSAS